MSEIAVIGGGASGLMAALFAAGDGNRVVLFEKQKKLGRKIGVTGNGKCNITNRLIDTKHYHGANPKFVHRVFSQFGLNETIDFFYSIGIPFVEEEYGRLFPASRTASIVVDIMEYELIKSGVEIQLHRRIDSITRQKGRFKLITAGKEHYMFDEVILSAGSCAYSPVGASKKGYELARSLSHSVKEPFPAIIPLNIPLKKLHTLQGNKCHCSLSVYDGIKQIESSSGELLFTGYGISGPAVLNISRSVNALKNCGKEPTIHIDFFPDYSGDELLALLNSFWSDPEKGLSFSMGGLLRKKIPAVVLDIHGINPDKKVKELSLNEKQEIISIFKEFSITAGNPRAFSEAVVAAGGVPVDEIDSSTMESRLVKGLYITGELLNVDGDSGGYNLQFAWSTGAIAGKSQHRQG